MRFLNESQMIKEVKKLITLYNFVEVRNCMAISVYDLVVREIDFNFYMSVLRSIVGSVSISNFRG